MYDVLTDSAKCAKMTRARCEISRGVGAEISYLDGQVQGKNVELITDVKIVQQWRMADWPESHFSTVTFGEFLYSFTLINIYF